MKIKEVIVVEGKNDIHRLKMFFDVDVVSVSGQGINMEMIKQLRHIQEERGLIVLMDPDNAGESIRSFINEHIEGCKNAFINKKDAQTKGDIGVEHASQKALESALLKTVTYGIESQSDLSLADLFELGLTGNKEAAIRRNLLAEELGIGHTNTKSFLKRCKMLGINAKDIKEKLL